MLFRSVFFKNVIKRCFLAKSSGIALDISCPIRILWHLLIAYLKKWPKFGNPNSGRILRIFGQNRNFLGQKPNIFACFCPKILRNRPGNGFFHFFWEKKNGNLYKLCSQSRTSLICRRDREACSQSRTSWLASRFWALCLYNGNVIVFFGVFLKTICRRDRGASEHGRTKFPISGTDYKTCRKPGTFVKNDRFTVNDTKIRVFWRWVFDQIRFLVF